jgi:hypothetical protein
MKTTNSPTSSSGIGFTGLLQILFLGLKLTGYINWPWWQVMLPTIIPFGFVILVLLVLGAVILIDKSRRP